jgi:hypothetical protein
MRNRVFFPQGALDEWMVDDRVDLSNEELHLKVDPRRYRVVEAVRVLREITGAGDPHDIVGHVKSKAFLTELGAEIMEDSMIIGDSAYDIVPGFVGAPIGSFDEHRAAHPEHASSTDEQILQALVAGG